MGIDPMIQLQKQSCIPQIGMHIVLPIAAPVRDRKSKTKQMYSTQKNTEIHKSTIFL